MSMILVTPLSAVEDTIRRYRPSHMMTLLSPEHMIKTPAGIAPAQHLRLGVNDVSEVEAAEMPPSERHVAQLIEFARAWPAASPLLVHCWAGISRSTAAAYIVLCDRLGPGAETAIALALRFRAPHAYPNSLMIRLADRALGRDGRMIQAVNMMGRGKVVAEGECVELPLELADL
jgi:predicted protein tyrosine phosphatase